MRRRDVSHWLDVLARILCQRDRILNQHEVLRVDLVVVLLRLLADNVGGHVVVGLDVHITAYRPDYLF